MRRGAAATTILLTLAGAGLAGGVLAKQHTTLFHQLHRIDAQRTDAHSRAAAVEARVKGTETELSERWSQVDVALRAARPIRHEVNDALLNWLGAFRQADRAAESPVAAADTRNLLRGAAAESLSSSLQDLDVIRRADAERAAFSDLVARRAALATELARNRAVIESVSDRRASLLERARTEGVSADLEATSVRLTELLAELEPAHPEFDFHRLKGTLARPVSGQPEHVFGASATLIRPGGWTWRPEAGAKVRTIGAGTVVHVGPLEGWGLVAVVDHGGPYRSIYAHLSGVSVNPGDRLERADVLGAVGASGSIDGPRFYLELRDGTGPVDPAPWFVQH
jgi:septal ring factor EnvC (AmiA/AmiB activator)